MIAIKVEEEFDNIISSLSSLILHYGRIQANEEHFPCNDPDNMDDVIARNKENVVKLRSIRLEIENLYTGAL